MSISTIRSTANSYMNVQQISDDNVFYNRFGCFRDWGSYLYGKAGDKGKNYLAVLRMPTYDPKYVKLLCIGAVDKEVLIYNVNVNTRTITFQGSVTLAV